MIRNRMYGPRARRVYYLLGTLLALVVLVGSVIWAVVAIGDGRPLHALFAVLLVLCAASFVWLAHRRIDALADDELREARASAHSVITEWARTGQGDFVARIRLRMFLLNVAILCLTGALAVAAARDAAWAAAGALGAASLFLLWFLLHHVRHREALVVDARGVQDRLRFGSLAWSEIQSAMLSGHHPGDTGAVDMLLDVSDVRPYRARQGPLAKILSWGMTSGKARLRIPVSMLDQAPHTIFAAVRKFHEHAAPRGSLLGSDDAYRIDPTLARERELDDRAFAIMKQLARDARAVAQDPASASDPDRRVAVARDVDAKLAEIRRLNDASAELSDARARDLVRRMAGTRERLRHVLQALGVAVLLAVVVEWGRALGLWR